MVIAEVSRNQGSGESGSVELRVESSCLPEVSRRGSGRAAKDVRVALLTNSLSPHNLPVCEYVHRAVRDFRAFVSADSDVSHNFPKPQASFPVILQRSFNWLRVPRKAYGHWQKGELHVPYDTYLQLRDYHPDVILSAQLGLRTALAVLYRRRHPQTRLILVATLSLHTEAQRNFLRRALRHWIVRRVDGALVNGQQGEEYLRLMGYVGAVYKTPYAIEESKFRARSYRPRESTFRLVYTGQLVPQKGLRAFCTVLNEWSTAHPEISVDFDIVGDGVEGRPIRLMKTSSNLRITVSPTTDQERLATHYHRADIMAFPTLGDEWGVVINEAMIAGLPVLGSVYSQAVAELVDEGKSGWIFDPQDGASTYAALDRAFSSSLEQLQTMSRNARQSIARLTPAIVGARFLDAIQSVLPGNEGR